MQDIIFSVQLRLGKRNENALTEKKQSESECEASGIEKWLNTARQIIKNVHSKH